MQIHEKIKQERIKSGLTPEELASKIGVPRTTYLYWEENTPKPDKIKKVAKALGLSESYFFGVKQSVESDKISDNTKPKDPLLEALEIIKRQNEYLEKVITASLNALSMDVNNNAVAIRAEIRGYGKYQLLKQADWNDQEFVKAMAVVDKIYGEEIKASDVQGNPDM